MLSIVLIVVALVLLTGFIWYFSKGEEWMMTEAELEEYRRNSDNG